MRCADYPNNVRFFFFLTNNTIASITVNGARLDVVAPDLMCVSHPERVGFAQGRHVEPRDRRQNPDTDSQKYHLTPRRAGEAKTAFQHVALERRGIRRQRPPTVTGIPAE